MKALLAWLPRSSATNSFAATKTNKRIEKGSGRFPIQSRPIYELRQQRDLPSLLLLLRESFSTSSLLAHCGGGRDKPGCLGPSAKLPRHFFLALEFRICHTVSHSTLHLLS